jgi:pectate lyase
MVTQTLKRISCVLLLVALAPWANALPSYEKKPDEWFRSAEGKRAVDAVLSWQSPHGSWPKNKDTSNRPFEGDPKKIEGTFDNGATTGELRFLARAFRVTGDARCERAVGKGIDGILKAQYPTGGWPQLYPPGTKYHRHITFNDGTMLRLMQLMRDVATSAAFGFVEAGKRQAAAASFDRAIACILKCQIVVDGVRTAWCAQHDEVDCSPRPARSYELASLSGGESAGILNLLMSLERPSPEVIAAIDAGAAWYDAVRLTGIRQVKVDGDKKIVRDPDAPPLWARFYEIGTNRPIFAGRDGVKKYDIAEIEPERRNGYSWYGDWGAEVARDHAAWKAKHRAAGG